MTGRLRGPAAQNTCDLMRTESLAPNAARADHCRRPMTTTIPITAKRPKAPLVRALLDACVTMLAILGTLACAMALAPEPGAGVLAVVLCLSFARSHLDHDLRGRLEAAVALPLVGLVAVGVGMLLLHQRWVGAGVFALGMFAAVWLRQFGPAMRRAGSLIALPLVVILTTPHVPGRHDGTLMAAVVPVAVALLALGWVTTTHALGRWLGLMPPRQTAEGLVASGRTTVVAAAPTPTTRLALQMAVAIGAAFAIGFLFFPQRWAWIVLTAYIVTTGNRGRLDVAYKSVLRVLGAGVGTTLALVVTLHLGSHDRATVAMILAAVFVGIWLRPLGYAWWALFVTLALALLQGFEGVSAQVLLALRLEEIVIGAVVAVAAAWCVYPLPSRDVLRRRMATTLALLADAFDPATPPVSKGAIDAAFTELEDVAPAFRALRWASRRLQPAQPADWIDALQACKAPAHRLMEAEQAPVAVRKALAAARKALREPAALTLALQDLQRTFDVGCPTLEAPMTQVE
jgi:hypothetical protein